MEDVSFPWEKVRRALQWLYAVKPWWRKYGERFTVRPYTMPPAPDRQYGGLCFSTTRWVLYVDGGMASAVSLEVLAGCLEREFYRCARNVHARLSTVSGSRETEMFAHVAGEMEICGILDEEFHRTDVMTVMNDHFVAQDFAVPLRERWGVTTVPYVPDEMMFLPAMFGFADGLGMEEYYRLLVSNDGEDDSSGGSGDPDEESDPSEDGGGGDDQHDGSDSRESSDGQDDRQFDDQSGDSEDGQDGDQGDDQSDDDLDMDLPMDGGEGSDAGDSEDGDPSQFDGEGNSDGGKSGGDVEGDGQSAGGDQSDVSQDGGQPGEPGADAQGDTPGEEGQTGQEGESGDGQQGSGSVSGADSSAETVDTGDDRLQGGPGGGGYRPDDDTGQDVDHDGVADNPTPAQDDGNQGEQPGDSDEPQSPQDRLSELLESPDRQFYTREHREPEDAEEPEDMFSTVQDSEAVGELLEGIAEAVSSGTPGRSPGDTVVEWAGEVVGAGRSWESEWATAVAATIGEYKVFGGQDLSYSVPNPNQPMVGPILMGMYDTTPRIAVIMDRSGSMKPFLARSMSAFADVVFTAVSGSGDPVDWISVDMSPSSYGQVTSVEEINDLKEKVNRGWGGTDIGPVIVDLCAGEFTWEGESVDAPDILVVCTDCMFTWPWMESRDPETDTLVLVASVKDRNGVDGFLPEWVDDDRFIYVGDD